MMKVESSLKLFSISERVLEKFPETQIGVLRASFDNSGDAPSQDWIENLKISLHSYLIENGITKENLTSHKSIDSWKQAYRIFGVKPKSYPSSVESLCKRVLKKEKIWKISPVVDLYNIVSVLSLLPMGGYDLKKIKGSEISLEFAKEGDLFEPLGKEEIIKTETSQVVYKDFNGKRSICWLWNYKDSKYTFIDNETKEAVFFIDSIEKENGKTVGNVNQSLEMLAFLIERFAKGKIYECGVANKKNPNFSIGSYRETKIDHNYFNKFFDSILKMKNENLKKEESIFQSSIHHCSEEKPEYLTISGFINLCALGDFIRLNEILEVRKDLLEAFDYFENSGLIHAVRGDHYKIIEIIVKNSKNSEKILNHKNKIGETALFIAARFGNKNSVKKLLEYNVDLSIKNNENKTALDVCLEKVESSDPKLKKEYIEIIGLLEKSLEKYL